MCGEHQRRRPRSTAAAGSSPRVRGTRPDLLSSLVPSRFIPACAGNTSADWPFATLIAVHPRVCGEHWKSAWKGSSITGSSPRVRGTPTPFPTRAARARFIPACAGNTRCHDAVRRCRAVHPRVCGEHEDAPVEIKGHAGSSPRVRGTLPLLLLISCASRFIPACAGNTGTGKPLRDLIPGSSPRVRGTLHCALLAADYGRFIPACAGNTQLSGQGRFQHLVHPRVCGEHGMNPASCRCSTGSSPRVRGTRGAVRCNSVCRACGSSPRVRGTHPRVRATTPPNRFIPACAGNTFTSVIREVKSSVHPRVCGEHVSRSSAAIAVSGSSPRVRGTLGKSLSRHTTSRFIPACAGNTYQAARDRLCVAVHPRVCGEHSRPSLITPSVRGSSPRVRGTRPDSVGEITNGRFIPACAGNTLLPTC